MFLESLGLGEFSGCDLDILPIIEQIPLEAEDVDVQSFLQHTLVERLLQQLEDGGNSILLDTSKMEETPAAILVPRINELRKKELEETAIQIVGSELIIYDVFMREVDRVVVPDRGDTVLLDDLWLTAHGYRILSKLGYGRRTDIHGLRKIQHALQKLDTNTTIKRVARPEKLKTSKISNGMQSLILKKVGS